MLDKLEYICWELHEHIEQIMVLIEYRLNQIECNHDLPNFGDYRRSFDRKGNRC